MLFARRRHREPEEARELELVELRRACEEEGEAGERCRDKADSLESGLENQECLRAPKAAGGRIAGPRVAARRLEEDYRLESTVLGTGMSGQVRAATCRKTGRKVAVKSFYRLKLSGKERSSEEWQEALDEVRIHMSLDHPNIAELLQVYDEPAATHVVMECLEGGEVFDRLVALKRYSEGEAADVVQQVLQAANYLHEQRVAHCDFKLENLVYAQKDSRRVKLIDFGLARRLIGEELLLGRCGTLQSMAPEVLKGAYCEKADLWSIGVLLYTLLIGRHPYRGSPEEVRAKVLAGKPDFAASFEHLSLGAQSFVRSLLTVDPGKRPSAKVALTHPWLCAHTTAREPPASQPIAECPRRKPRVLRPLLMSNAADVAMLVGEAFPLAV